MKKALDVEKLNAQVLQTNTPSKPSAFLLSNLKEQVGTPHFQDNQPTSIDQQKYEEILQMLSNRLQQKQSKIDELDKKIHELKIQEEYLLKSIQQIRDKHTTHLLNLEFKYKNIISSKDAQIQQQKKSLMKLKQWLKQQKCCVYRMVQCIKIKDLIIENLEKQNKERRKKDASKRNKRSTGNKTNTNNDILENIQNSMNFDRQFETPSKNDCQKMEQNGLVNILMQFINQHINCHPFSANNHGMREPVNSKELIQKINLLNSKCLQLQLVIEKLFLARYGEGKSSQTFVSNDNGDEKRVYIN